MDPAAAAFGLAIGMALGMLGGGGSVLAVPVLVYVLDQDVHEATTSSLLIVTAGALAGGLGHARKGRVCWRHAGAFIAAAMPGVLAGTALAEAVGGRTLIGTFAVVMLAAAVAMWRRADVAVGPDDGECPTLLLSRDVTAGAAIGFLTGFFGVGGGFLIVPTLVIFLSLSMRLAVGTSLAIVTVTSLMGLAAHLAAGRDLDADLTAVMTLACVAGAIGGAAVAGLMPQPALSRVFALITTGVAVYLLASATLLGGPP